MKQPTASTRAPQQASETQTEGSCIALHANVDDARGQTGVLGLLSEERLAAELGRSRPHCAAGGGRALDRLT
jgi:hypothetical protein